MHIQKSAEVIVAARDSAKSVSSNCDFANVVKLQTSIFFELCTIDNMQLRRTEQNVKFSTWRVWRNILLQKSL